MRYLLILLSFALSLGGQPLEAKAPEAKEKDKIQKKAGVAILPSNEIYHGDYFVFNSDVEISGLVKGDLYAAATQVFIDGEVQGDVLIVGGNVDISGTVTGNVRVTGGQVNISGKVGRNISLIAGNIVFSSGATVGGNVVCAAGNVELASSIGADATIVSSNLRVSSEIKGNLDAYAGEIRITSKAVIGKNFNYRSNSSAWIDEQAKIYGEVSHRPSLLRGFLKESWIQGLLLGSKVAGYLMNFLYSLVVGWILIRLFPQKLAAALKILSERPWKALSVGIMVLILLPVASLILLMTVLGAPFALTLIALNIIGFYTAKVISILWVSNFGFSKIGFKHNRLSTLCVGLICYFFLTAIPYFGTALALASMLFGVGAGILGQARHPHH